MASNRNMGTTGVTKETNLFLKRSYVIFKVGVEVNFCVRLSYPDIKVENANPAASTPSPMSEEIADKRSGALVNNFQNEKCPYEVFIFAITSIDMNKPVTSNG